MRRQQTPFSAQMTGPTFHSRASHIRREGVFVRVPLYSVARAPSLCDCRRSRAGNANGVLRTIGSATFIRERRLLVEGVNLRASILEVSRCRRSVTARAVARPGAATFHAIRQVPRGPPGSRREKCGNRQSHCAAAPRDRLACLRHSNRFQGMSEAASPHKRGLWSGESRVSSGSWENHAAVFQRKQSARPASCCVRHRRRTESPLA